MLALNKCNKSPAIIDATTIPILEFYDAFIFRVRSSRSRHYYVTSNYLY